MKYRVTGGPTGDSGIEVGGKRYEVNAEIEANPKQVEWLVEQGYLAAPGKTPSEPVKAVAPKEAEAPAESDGEDN